MQQCLHICGHARAVVTRRSAAQAAPVRAWGRWLSRSVITPLSWRLGSLAGTRSSALVGRDQFALG
jgi:hypothetical protein